MTSYDERRHETSSSSEPSPTCTPKSASSRSIGTQTTQTATDPHKLTQEEWSEMEQSRLAQYNSDMNEARSHSAKISLWAKYTEWKNGHLKIEPRVVDKHFVDSWLETQNLLDKIKSNSPYRDWKRTPEWLYNMNGLSGYTGGGD